MLQKQQGQPDTASVCYILRCGKGHKELRVPLGLQTGERRPGAVIKGDKEDRESGELWEQG